MNAVRLAVSFCVVLVLSGLSQSQALSQVLVTDSGIETRTIGPGAPPHTIGLQGHRQTIVMDTGKQTFGLRYGVARDTKDPLAAIPGEGYIGMPEPVGCNWYAGGFFDVQINGRSIGTTLLHSLTGRSSGRRGTTDFVFDAPQAVVRVRFVAQAGGDCLYAQVLLEPKAEVKSVRVATRCYPSAFVSDAARHVLTPARDLVQGARAQLDVENEWWTLYYDSIYDAGHISPTHRGVGPCAMLWLPNQTEKAGFTVGGYGIETIFTLKPGLRDLRFLFLDYAGSKNASAKANLGGRAQALRQELAAFPFTDPLLANWPLSQKQAEIQHALATLPTDKEAAAKYDRWARELAAQLKLVHSRSAGAIMAEANAAKTISQWDRELPALRLKMLLNEI